MKKKERLHLMVPVGKMPRRKKPFGNGLDDRIKDVVQELRDIFSKVNSLDDMFDLKAIIEDVFVIEVMPDPEGQAKLQKFLENYAPKTAK